MNDRNSIKTSNNDLLIDVLKDEIDFLRNELASKINIIELLIKEKNSLNAQNHQASKIFSSDISTKSKHLNRKNKNNNSNHLINNNNALDDEICGKIFEKIIFNNLYKQLTTHHLITKNQSGFRPGDSTTNQLIDLVDEIHQAFDSTKSLEVRAVFLDISKAFDKVWPTD